jgi:hypothetical protein
MRSDVSYAIRAVEAMSQLWDIRQPVRMLAGGTLEIRYQETSSRDIEGFMCDAVTVVFRVWKPVRLF